MTTQVSQLLQRYVSMFTRQFMGAPEMGVGKEPGGAAPLPRAWPEIAYLMPLLFR
jgi:hypothetical protein